MSEQKLARQVVEMLDRRKGTAQAIAVAPRQPADSDRIGRGYAGPYVLDLLAEDELGKEPQRIVERVKIGA